MKEEIQHTCENCQDYIVCFSYDKLKTDEEAKNCKEWSLDFLAYQEWKKEKHLE